MGHLASKHANSATLHKGADEGARAPFRDSAALCTPLYKGGTAGPGCRVGGSPHDIRERDLQKHVRAFAEGLGWKTAVTWTSIHSPKGWPDLFLVRGPEFCAIELKSEKGKVSEHQEGWLDALRQLPGARFVGVVRPSNWFAGELDEVLTA